MAMPGIDRDDPRPLHVQVRSILHRQVTERDLPPGRPLPTEEELQHQFGVSRSVIRQALSGLASQGLIQRQRGRGTVVTAPTVLRRHVQRAGGLEQDAAARGQSLRTRVVSMEASPPPSAAQSALNTPRTWKIERIRYLDETPMVFMQTWVSRDLFPHFTRGLLEDASLLQRMQEHGHTPAGGPRQVQAVAADETLAQALGVAPGEPLLLLEGVTQGVDGQGLEWFRVWHHANTVFDVDAQAPSPGAVPAQHLKHLRHLVHELDASLATLEEPGR